MMLQKPIGVFLSLVIMVTPLYAQKISGKIIDALTKVPLVNAKVTIVELKKEVTPDSTGFYEIDNLNKGTYSLRFEAPQYVKYSKTVKLIDLKGQTGTTDITLDATLYAISTNVDQSQGQQEIKYFFPGHTNVVIEVCDSTGKSVRMVFDRTRIGGMRTYRWNGTDNWGKTLPAGKYTCKIKCGNLYTSRTLAWDGGEKR